MFKGLSHLTKVKPTNLLPKLKPTSSISPKIEEYIYKFKIVNDSNPVPAIINGVAHYKGEYQEIISPYDKDYYSAKFHYTPRNLLNEGLQSFPEAKKHWNHMGIDKRLEVFLTAADKIENKYYDRLIAATILGQNKTPYEAELDIICELADFIRFNVDYVQQIYKKQPISPEGTKNISQYHPLNGFVAAVTPFNFSAIAGNMVTSALMLGNSVIWKPSDNAVLSNFMIWEILVESGMPPEICNFIPMEPNEFMSEIKNSNKLGGITFTGSSEVFENIYENVGKNIRKYDNYPRLIGETGGKNFHFIDILDLEDEEYINHIVDMTFESAYNYSGQKCSACSRVYLPEDLYPIFKEKMIKKSEDLFNNVMKGDINYGLINHTSFIKGQKLIENILEDKETELVYGGAFNNNKHYLMEPVMVKCDNPNHCIFHDEYFLPLLAVYTYKTEDRVDTLNICSENNNNYCLTGSIFSKNKEFAQTADDVLKYSAGNFYINDKSTGAVVGQQPFGGSGKSGTNDKAGDINVLYRYMNQRNIKINERFTSYKNY